MYYNLREKTVKTKVWYYNKKKLVLKLEVNYGSFAHVKKDINHNINF